MILLDTSGLLAALFPDQRHHEACRRTLVESSERLLLSPFVLAELDYLVTKLSGFQAEAQLLAEVARGAYELVGFSAAEVAEARGVIEQHRDLEPGLADASIVVLARRYRTRRVLTLDERHFRVLTGLGGAPFELLPADR